MAKKDKKEKTIKENRLKEDLPGLSTERNAWIVSGIAALAYYFYSFKSVGYYQHDEIAHYFSMLDFWKDPNSVLGNWSKTGYKLVYALPALLGSKFLIILNSVLSGFTCYLAYKLAAQFTKSWAILAAVLLAIQPFWIELSFRNYADSFSGILLIASVLLHYRNKLIPAALILSYGCLVRQEFYLIAVPYGIYLLIKQRWAPAFLLALFPVLYSIWGYLHTGEALYILEDAKRTSDLYTEQFEKNGFFHFWKMSFVFWGSVPVLLLVTFFIQIITHPKGTQQKELFKQSPAFVWVPVGIYFLLHSLFNWDALDLAASPNLRYMNAIGPLVAVLGTLAVSAFGKTRNKLTPYYIGLGAFLLITLAFMTYADNGVKLSEEERSYGPWLVAAAAAVVLIGVKKPQTSILLIAGLALVSGIIPVQPRTLSEEDKTVDRMVDYLIKNDLTDKQVMTNHIMFQYFYEKETNSPHPNQTSIDSAFVAEAPIGSTLIIDTHYSLRKDFPAPSNEVRDIFMQYRIQGQAGQGLQLVLSKISQSYGGAYELKQQIQSSDQRFYAFIFERVK